MIIAKTALSRRTMLRGMGATLALPARCHGAGVHGRRETAARPVNRLGVTYVPNGMIMQGWTPPAEGAGFEFMPTMAPLSRSDSICS
jgi:hypothetical protein